jgi:predicted nucleic acid-binding Zn ribbon protein
VARRRKSSGEAVGAGPLMDRVLTRYGARRELREHRIITAWRAIVGEAIADRAVPDGLQGGVLYVEVKSSAWLHQLSFQKQTLIENANRAVGDPPLVEDVRFHLGPRRAQGGDLLAPAARIRRPPPRPRPLPAPATGARLAAIESEAARVEDEDLRAIIVEARRKLNL